jgi:FkbM family methyltransferase
MNKKVYIEAGAHDGLCGSRSLHLSGSDYFGILVEPTHTLYEKCVNSRAYNAKCYCCALVSFDYKDSTVDMRISKVDNGMNTSIEHVAPHSDSTYSDTVVAVPARTLQSLLDENNITVVDYMFLDTEGAEKNVIDGIDHTKTTIHNLEIELHHFRRMGVDGEINMHKSNLEKFNMRHVDTWECSGGYKINFKYIV